MADPVIVVKGRYDGSSLDSGLTRSAGKMSSFAKTAGRVAAVGLLAAGAAAIKFGTDAVKAASDAEESVNAVRVSYGKAADGILALGKNSATSLGLSRSQLNSTAVQFSAFAQQIAGKGGDVVGTFKSIASRATDFASVMNLDVDQALQIFQSGLAGETEPLRKFGIDLSAAAVQSFAYAKGIAKTGDELTEGQKVQARYQLLLKETAKTQGDFANTSDGLANRQRILAAQFEDVKAKLGTLLLPVATKFFGLIADEGIPALERAAEWLSANKTEIERFGTSVKDAALPPLEALGSVLVATVKFFSDLPGPVKTVGIEVALAAVAVAKLAPILTSVKAAGVGFVGTMTDAETRTKKLGQAARVAGGVAGMVLLAEGAKRADSGVGTLLTTAGGFATGFAVGGPIGGAIGGAVGLFTGLQKSVEASQQAFRDSIVLNEDYAASFDAVTGAITKATRQTIFKNALNNDQIDIGRMIGIPDRAIVQAIAGNVGQLEQIVARVNKLTGTRKQLSGPNADLFFFNKQSASDFIASLKYGEQQLTAEQRAFIKALEAAKSFKQQLEGLPPKAITEFKALGIAPTAAEVAALAKKYGLLDNKQIKTILKAVGGEATVKDVQKIIAKLNEVDPTGERANRALARVGSKPGNLGPFLAGLNRGIAAAERNASSGAARTANNLGSGLANGLSRWADDVRTAAANLANIAVAAVDKAAENNSPSKRTTKSGYWLGAGLAKGLAESTPLAKDAAVKLVAGVLGAVDGGSAGVARALDSVTKAVERMVKLKDDKKEAAREREILAALKDRTAALRANGKEQDKLNEKIRKERDELESLIETRKQAAAATAANIASYSSLTSLISTEEGALNDAPSLLERMRQRLGDTQEFSRLISSLRSSGLAETLVQQIEGAGVEGGLALAAAISAGGPAAIDEFTELQRQIDAAAGTIGNNSASAMYDAGIAIQAGLVAGLEADKTKLEAVARRIARTLLRALKDELGIHSPSTKGEEIGVDMLRGIKLGLSDTYARSLGSTTAAALVDGFGTPTLKARATLPEYGGSSAVGGNTYKITVVAPVGSSSAEIGGVLVDKIKAFEKSGGRALATG